MGLHLFVGCLNREAPYFQGARGVGIATYAFDEDTLAFEKRFEIGGIDNPTFLAFDTARNRLYATSEVFGWQEGLVSAYAFDSASGTLGYLNKQPTLGSITAYTMLAGENRLLVANYGMGKGGPDRAVVVFGIEPDGSLSPALASVSHKGTGPDASRQERSHAHSLAQTPDGALTLVADLGLDTLFGYRLRGDGQLAKVSESHLPPGSGPRHMVFHPAGHLLFVFNELNSTIGALRREFDDSFTLVDGAQAVPPSFRPQSHGADIHISPDGRFIYGSNRGHDSIVALAVNQQSGGLSPAGWTPSGGQTPRNFAMTPSGRHLLVANQNSDVVAILSRNADTGALTETGRRIEIGTPMCVLAVSA
jgi:6-phosphogluconolactonase